MKIRHHLYTFLPERKNQRGGAQTIYASPGLSADAKARLERHSIYERPDWLGPDDPNEKYPISYGYFLLDEAHGVLARVVYRGRHGIRAGNFLAHHIIFPLYAFEEGDPLLHLEDPVLFRSDYREDEAPPVDIDLAVPPEREIHPNELIDAPLLACIVAALLQTKGPRVVALLPQELFEGKRGLQLVLSLINLLPYPFRPACTFRTFQLDPTEPKFKLILSPVTTSNQKTIRGDSQFLLFDPQGNLPALPSAAIDYAEMAIGLLNSREPERLSLLQEGFASLFEGELSKVQSVRATLSLYLQAVEASTEAQLTQLLSKLSSLDEPSGRLIGAALYARFGAAYLQALSAGKLSAVALRVVRLAPTLDSPELKRALLAFIAAATKAPERTPWSELFSLLPALPEETQRALSEAIAANPDGVCEKLSSEQLMLLSDITTSPDLLLLIMEKLKARNELAENWPRLERREAALQQGSKGTNSQKIFLLLSDSGLHQAASDLFTKKLLPSSQDISPLLPAVIQAMQRSRIEDGEVGRRLLAQANDDAKKQLILYSLQNQLLAAWRVSISEQPISLLAEVERAADTTIKPGLFSEELARVGLWRQVLRLRLLSSQEPFREAIEPAMLAAKTPAALESIIDIALEKPNEVLARKLLLLLVNRANEAQLAAKIESLAEKIYNKLPEVRRYAILPATLLEKRATRFWGARVLHNELNRTSTSAQRRELLAACLDRLTLVDGSETDVALALRSAFHDATDERVRWLSEEAKRAGLLVISQIAAQELR